MNIKNGACALTGSACLKKAKRQRKAENRRPLAILERLTQHLERIVEKFTSPKGAA